jgi:hypothetical protein
MEGVTDTEKAEIQLEKINNQAMNISRRSHVLVPAIMFTGAFGGEQEIGTKMTISPAIAVSVLDPYTEISFTVRTPEGKIAKDVNGKELKDVSSYDEYVLEMSEYGRYLFTYKYCDSSGESKTYPYNVICLDKIAPELTVEDDSVKGSVGKAISVPEFTATDNYSKVTVFIMIINPENVITTYTEGLEYVPTIKGKHVIRYMVFDENYNMIIKDVDCMVS